MAEERVQRRLAAILAADVVGYSRLMGADEEGTLSRLKILRRELFDPKTKQYGGRIFKTTGDGAFVEFNSAVEAVKSASDIQEAIAARNAEVSEDQKILLRIGISLGDVIVEGSDLYGNGVNVASRMEGLAEPGGICVSGNVHEHIGRSLDVNFEDLGEQSIKNIDLPVRSYRVIFDSSGATPTISSDQGNSPSLFDQPAVAVLPFENMSGDPEQEYFSDGLTEDIITALLRWRSFPVIARNSTFAYKGQSPDIREVGKALGARYVVEGSVRKAGSRVRVTAQLINAETGHHIWAERYDHELDDIFALQDEITTRVAAIIEPAIAGAEQKQLAARPPRELGAWDLCIQGQYLIYISTKESNQRAREKFQQAIEIDPDYARAWSGLAYTYNHDIRLGYAESREEALRKSLDASRRAVELDDSDAEAHAIMARVLYRSGQEESGLEALRRALDLNPQNTTAIMSAGAIHAFNKNEPEEGIRWLEKALEISPLDPRNFILKTHLAVANICAANYERAAEQARDAIRQRDDYLESHAALASALGYLGRAADADKALGEFRDQVGEYVKSNLMWNQTTKESVLNGLRKAGWEI
jgi:adenylate cyclase